MESTILLDLVSPEQLVFNDKASMIIVPGKEGDIGVLPGHSKLLSSLRSGRVMIYGEDKQLLKSFFVTEGFVEINPEKCILLAEEVFEILYKPKISSKIIIKEYLNASNFFLEDSQTKYLNALLDKIAKKIRISNA